WACAALEGVWRSGDIEGLPPVYRTFVDKYAYVDVESTHVLCWDHAKYVNHSCLPNCQKGQAEFEVAVRDISAGEELRSDYASLNLDRPEPFRCSCGAPECRATIQPDDAAALADEWAPSFHPALTIAETVPQPLAPFFPNTSHGALRVACT